jgi:hypothetical protein
MPALSAFFQGNIFRGQNPDGSSAIFPVFLPAVYLFGHAIQAAGFPVMVQEMDWKEKSRHNPFFREIYFPCMTKPKIAINHFTDLFPVLIPFADSHEKFLSQPAKVVSLYKLPGCERHTGAGYRISLARFTD